MSATPQYGSRFVEQAAERSTQLENGGAQNSDGKTKVATRPGHGTLKQIRAVEWEHRAGLRTVSGRLGVSVSGSL